MVDFCFVPGTRRKENFYLRWVVPVAWEQEDERAWTDSGQLWAEQNPSLGHSKVEEGDSGNLPIWNLRHLEKEATRRCVFKLTG